MHDLSFQFDNPSFTFRDISFSIQIFTYENVYGLNGHDVEVRRRGGEFEFISKSLTWAGGQEKCSGICHGRVYQTPNDSSFRFDIHASYSQKIRCIKLILHDFPRMAISSLMNSDHQEIQDSGLILNYPEAWQGLTTPLVVFNGTEGQFFYVRSLDVNVREKRIAMLPKENSMNIELIWEEDAILQSCQATMPTWEIGWINDPETVYQKHMKMVEEAYHLETWESRKDVPKWARKISLVVAIHMQHYTGYIFNTYSKALEIAEWFSQHFPAKNTIYYLPGWEGRYYWQYGDYRPDDRLGGEAGFSKMMEGIHRLGANCMPMFGANVVNKNTLNFEQWGKPAQRIHASGNICEGSVDWDSSRDYDLGWGVMLNPGAPTWQNRLVEQIDTLRNRYQFKSAFLDISAIWWNDPSFHVYDGIVQLIHRLKEGHDDFLLAGEGWYDALSVCFPFIQCGHTDGRMNWPDIPYKPAFEKYCRSFGHLCLGDPGRLSTGVHELGKNPTWQTPTRKSIIPTITIVDRTLEDGRNGVETILEQAKRYLSEYL